MKKFKIIIISLFLAVFSNFAFAMEKNPNKLQKICDAIEAIEKNPNELQVLNDPDELQVAWNIIKDEAQRTPTELQRIRTTIKENDWTISALQDRAIDISKKTNEIFKQMDKLKRQIKKTKNVEEQINLEKERKKLSEEQKNLFSQYLDENKKLEEAENEKYRLKECKEDIIQTGRYDKLIEIETQIKKINYRINNKNSSISEYKKYLEDILKNKTKITRKIKKIKKKIEEIEQIEKTKKIDKTKRKENLKNKIEYLTAEQNDIEKRNLEVSKELERAKFRRNELRKKLKELKNLLEDEQKILEEKEEEMDF